MTSEQPHLLRQDDVPTSPVGRSPLEDTMVNGLQPPDLRKRSPSSRTAPPGIAPSGMAQPGPASPVPLPKRPGDEDPGRTARLAPPAAPGPAPSRATRGAVAAPRPRRMPSSSGSLSGGWRSAGQRTPLARMLTVIAACIAAILVGVVVAYAVRSVVGSSSTASVRGAGAPLGAQSPGGSATAAAPQSLAPSDAAASGTVPAAGDADGWVSATAAPEGLGFSHPPGWTLRQDQTGIFYTDPGSEGLQEVGVKRDTGSHDTAEAARQYAANNLLPLAGAKAGQVTTAVDGSAAVQVRYTRNGVAARFLVRAVTHGPGVAILVVRAPDDGSPTAEHLLAGLSGTLAST